MLEQNCSGSSAICHYESVLFEPPLLACALHGAPLWPSVPSGADSDLSLVRSGAG